MNVSLSQVLFWLFAGAGAISWYLVMRFLTEVKKTGALNEKELEALSDLLISGSGGGTSQWAALAFILDRGYQGIADASTVRAGDCARLSWLVTFGLMACTGLSLMVYGW